MQKKMKRDHQRTFLTGLKGNHSAFSTKTPTGEDDMLI